MFLNGTLHDTIAFQRGKRRVRQTRTEIFQLSKKYCMLQKEVCQAMILLIITKVTFKGDNVVVLVI